MNTERALTLISAENDKSKSNYENFWSTYNKIASIIFSCLNMKQNLFPGLYAKLRIRNTEVIKKVTLSLSHRWQIF